MNLLAGDLRANGFRPVFFNAWHNQRENNVLASLFEGIRKTALPSVSSIEGVLFRARLLARRCLRHWVSLSLLCLVLAASAGFLEIRPTWAKETCTSFIQSAPTYVQGLAKRPGSSDAPAWIVFVGAASGLVGAVARGLRAFGVKPEEMLANKLGASDKVKPYHVRFAQQFEDVAAALAPRRMVIFIDDLDRCRPEYVLDTLEAINFLVSSGECFVIMGLAPEQVKAAVGLAFKDIAEEMVTLQTGTGPSSRRLERRFEP